MLFHAALFSLLRRELAIWPHSIACLRSSSDGFMGRLPVHAFFQNSFDFYTNGRKVNLVKIAQPLNWDSAVFPSPVGTEKALRDAD